MKRRIGIIGFGNMGSAITERLKSKYKIFVFDKDKVKIRNLKGIKVADNIIELVNNVETVILAVKPQDFDELLNKLKELVKGKLVISIAAGIGTGDIEKILRNARVVRAMPNLPAKFGKGVSCLCKGKFASGKDLNFARQLFNRLGGTRIIKENMMAQATAVSGSGPGFYFDIVESHSEDYKHDPQKVLSVFIDDLTEAAKDIGFKPYEAKFLTISTGSACEFLLRTTKLPPSELKKQVASKGGTTEAGLKVLHKGGSLKQAVKAALKRAKELSRR